MSQESKDRILVAFTLSILSEVCGEQLKPFLKEFLRLSQKMMQDAETDVYFYTIVTLSHFVSFHRAVIIKQKAQPYSTYSSIQYRTHTYT